MTKCDFCASNNKCTTTRRSECAVRDYLFFEPEYAADFVTIKKILQKCGVQSPEYLAAILIENGVMVKR